MKIVTNPYDLQALAHEKMKRDICKGKCLQTKNSSPYSSNIISGNILENHQRQG